MLVRYLKRLSGRLTAVCAYILVMSLGTLAHAQGGERIKFDIPAQALQAALSEYARQSGAQLLYAPQLAAGKTAPAIKGEKTAVEALREMLNGSGLYYGVSESGAILIDDTPDVVKKAAVSREAARGNAGGATETATAGPAQDAVPYADANGGEETASGMVAAPRAGSSAIEEVIVTAQKRSENIQDVPIAISAFSAEELNEQKLEGGPDLLRAIPNVTFSKNNFSGYNFSIRGIGTKAVSVTTDPGVAVASNNISLIRNRLFEQEYFDVSRVEVLRGPQGTLYGRNATGGVINVLTNKAKLNQFDGSVKVEVGNYDARRGNAFINIPLIDDMLAIRGAGSFTYRSGYDYNTVTENHINGRDLWSGRVSALFQPVDSVRANFMWERFSEDDDRSRTGKQLCHHDPGPESMGSYTNLDILTRAEFSQGCKTGSLYDKDAFGTPNGLSIPFMLFAAGGVTNPHIPIGYDANGNALDLVKRVDPYGNKMQSTNLREIASIFDPKYQAKADLYELNIDVDVTPALLLSSQTGYNKDNYYSSQDYNRFNSDPVFNNSAGLSDGSGGISNYEGISPGGVFCDPQLGCSNTIAGLDISRAKSEQFSQELRLASSFDGPVNFSVGANYTHYKTEEDYFVMYNVITGIADLFNHLNSASPSGGYGGPIPVSEPCTNGYSWLPPPYGEYNPVGAPPGSNGCIYVDPNPAGSIDGNGHNYFRSRNPYALSSYGLFGETYWQVTEDFKLTAGLRYNDDRKSFTRVPTQVLLSASVPLGGTVDSGYPVAGTLKQKSDAFTGRLGFDWKINLPFTQKSMVYAFYSRGYKAGGLNPPGIGYAPCSYYGQEDGCYTSFVTPSYSLNFRPEYVNAFEIGSKNALLGGSLILNATAFFYDYKDYQVSKIVDRTAINENFDAKVWGAELESLWQATPNLRFNMALGYQGSRLANGSKSIDLMDRTQGNSDYVVMKPWVQLPSNCVVPRYLVERAFNAGYRGGDASQLCPGGGGGFSLWGLPGFGPDELADLPNGGQGFYADLSGNELPNAPHWTASLGAAYTWYLKGGWEATLRADYYRQGDSYARVYNDKPYDRLRGWGNANALISVALPSDGLTFELYAKNVFNDMPITDAFLNSDDTSLTTNVFTLDPRLFGFSVRKDF
jgi:iron complex outermembrane receptor protein